MPAANAKTDNHIFLSYAKEDTSRVQVLVDALEKQGWEVFWDRTIPAGQEWDTYIGARLKSASVVVAVWSKHSVNSRWVRSEVRHASNRDALVPVLIDDVEPPLGLDHIQAANLIEWSATGGGNLPPHLKSSILLKMPSTSEDRPPQPEVGWNAGSIGQKGDQLSEQRGPSPTKKHIQDSASRKHSSWSSIVLRWPRVSLAALAILAMVMVAVLRGKDSANEVPTESKLFDNWNDGKVLQSRGGPPEKTTFTISKDFLITSISTYHDNINSGRIILKRIDGQEIGNCDPGIKKSPVCRLDIKVPRGTYEVDVSDRATWSYNEKSGNAGFTWVKGVASQ